ncbi:MAG: hypothetical protein AAF623_10270 [Planctomycetota bacterium]
MVKIIDRRCRTILAESLRLYLEEQITQKRCLEAWDYCSTSKDRTVREIYNLFFLDFDEWLPSELSKSEWDELQRVLLILDSDRHLVHESVYHWSKHQVTAAAALVFCMCVGMVFGWLNMLIFLGVPAGFISILISRAKKIQLPPYAGQVYPFGSLSELRATYEEVGHFKKQRHRRRPDNPRSRMAKLLTWKIPSSVAELNYYFFLIVVFPTIVLLPFQMFPVHQLRSFVLPDPALPSKRL